MAAVSESRMQGLRPPGATLGDATARPKGLPSRPNESLLLRKAVNTAGSDSTTPSPSVSPMSNGHRVPGIEEKDLPAKPLPPRPESIIVPEASSLSPRGEEGRRQNPVGLPRSPKPPPQSPPPNDDLPLEEFIPEPEEQQSPQGPSMPVEVERVDRMNDANALSMPPLPEPLIVPPLTKVHFSCYQSHRSMSVSNNVWYALACMTCYKIDQEVRYRCTFCCLRICTGCYQSLQKCKNRSLAELVSTSSSPSISKTS